MPTNNLDIRSIRAALEMTQEEFARALDTTTASVSRWENGRRKPSRMALRAIRDLIEDHNVPAQ
jgi:DNA-binding transcriptional regulator YiaG